MYPAIGPIPTFSTYLGSTTGGRGINQATGKYSIQSGSKDDPDRWDRSDHRVHTS
jgi:hypothetical protein